MNDEIQKLIDLIYQHYGKTGLLVCLIALLALYALALILLSRLPESPNVIVWSKCSSCRYKRKKDNVFVLSCPKYEAPRWNQFRSPICPNHGCEEGCRCIAGLPNPSVFKRDDLPEDVEL